MRTSKAVWFVLTGLFLTAAAQADGPKDALDAGKAAIETIDKGNYAESWEQSAGVFKEAVQKDQWASQLQAVRAPLGSVVSRTVLGSQQVNALPGAPPGDYVVISYKTTFQSKPQTVETFTVQKASDGKWRMAGYYIR